MSKVSGMILFQVLRNEALARSGKYDELKEIIFSQFKNIPQYHTHALNLTLCMVRISHTHKNRS